MPDLRVKKSASRPPLQDEIVRRSPLLTFCLRLQIDQAVAVSYHRAMAVRFARTYVDQVFAERDTRGMHHLISVVGRDRPLPGQFWLFCRLIEWCGSTRSGVWQYYEGLPEEEFERISQALDRHGLSEIAERYRFGRAVWGDPNRASGLDKWIDEHEEQVERSAFDLISKLKDHLL